MALGRTFCILLLCAVNVAFCAVANHEITYLPGWLGSLPTKQYSGYLTPSNDGKDTKRLHYWFVESANDPATDPVVLWLNGGPGCSSLDGYFAELGPLHFYSFSKAKFPTLVSNPYAWNRIANMIFLESPVGVGFSYSTDPEIDYMMDDYQTAYDNYGFLVSFFRAYPEYRENDFYITGESYAGIYIPTLVEETMMMNENGSCDDYINLKGFMVGNGCIGNDVGSCSYSQGLQIHMQYYYSHGLISKILYEELVDACGNYSAPSKTCSSLTNKAAKAIGNVDIYDLYTPCISSLTSAVPRMRNFLKEHHLATSSEPYFGPAGCIDDRVASNYFDNRHVREAIHVEPNSVIGHWRVCTEKINYIYSADTLLPIYPTLIKTYRTLIYNGDADGCVPYIGDEMWTSGLNFTVKEAWRSWSVDKQVAGYVTEYDENGFKFVTVKGSGHMVPQYRPKHSYAMFERYIKNLPF